MKLLDLTDPLLNSAPGILESLKSSRGPPYPESSFYMNRYQPGFFTEDRTRTRRCSVTLKRADFPVAPDFCSGALGGRPEL